MMITPKKHPLSLFCLLACIFLSSLSHGQKLQNRNGKTVDFSGHWEMDYADSDNIQARLDTMVRELQRRAARQSNGNMNRSNSSMSMGSGSGYNSGPSVIGLAQMADMITQSQLLEVTQSDHEIKVKREQTFALSCEFYGDYFQTVETPFGNESCGWDSHQMLFRILLPEGVSIQHRFTLGPSGERLNVATTVVSDRVSYPFTLNRVYNRFEPGKSGISCEVTLTRGKVCTTEGSK
ncbi:MAG: hypothetical protein V7754_07110 [Halioglobus sp.]